eukprot:CAMPEP_0179966750 /NCGR_PEP_ID=MMETSP0983-20121128/32721_1 /TAXON_ID=483367 /ORGANISM="non described non described, Strain CCMP 2436" /LENGTH=150 /DNA_ID=CAMNT_0021879949 /DNA_START=54 /DNA_END=507 /DNA_ORIENTATION=-
MPQGACGWIRLPVIECCIQAVRPTSAITRTTAPGPVRSTSAACHLNQSADLSDGVERHRYTYLRRTSASSASSTPTTTASSASRTASAADATTAAFASLAFADVEARGASRSASLSASAHAPCFMLWFTPSLLCSIESSREFSAPTSILK